MGERKLVDRTLRPMTYGLTTVTPASVTTGKCGVIPIGNYKGVAAFFDLDKLANQPLVFAERQHILGVLNGSIEARDLVTVNIPLGAATPVGTSYRGRLTVPASEVWFITEVVTTINVEAATPNGFWRCSLWTDPAATPDADGQAFNAVAMTNVGGPYWDDFFEGAGVFAPNTNKPVALRLPGGYAITLQLVTTVLGTAGSAHTLQLFGYVGKQLVA